MFRLPQLSSTFPVAQMTSDCQRLKIDKKRHHNIKVTQNVKRNQNNSSTQECQPKGLYRTYKRVATKRKMLLTKMKNKNLDIDSKCKIENSKNM